jgi:hypothetical protein
MVTVTFNEVIQIETTNNLKNLHHPRLLFKICLVLHAELLEIMHLSVACGNAPLVDRMKIEHIFTFSTSAVPTKYFLLRRNIKKVKTLNYFHFDI